MFDILKFLDWAFGARHNRDFTFHCERSGRHFVSQRVDRFRRRPYEYEASFFNVSGKSCVFGQKSVSGMYHVHPMLQSNFDDLFACKVCADRGILTLLSDNVGFIRLYSGEAWLGISSL